MPEIATATAAPGKIVLGDREFSATPLNYRALGEFENSAVRYYLQRIERALEYLPADLAREKRADAASVASRISFMRRAVADNPDHVDSRAVAAMNEFASSFEGGVMYVWLMIRPSHPETTMEEIGERLMTRASLDHAMRQAEQISKAEGSTKDGPEPKKP